MGLDRALDQHQTALGAGDGAADSDQVQLGIDLDDVQVLDGDLVTAHLAGADVALEDAAGIRGGTHRAGVTVDRAAAVAHRSTLSAVALDGALIAVALAGAGHVHKVALFEGVSLDDVADVQLGRVLKVELAQVLLGADGCLVQVAHLGLGQLTLGDILVAQLNGRIALFLDSLLLNDRAGTRLDDGDGDHLAVFVEDLRHADFLADDCFHV